MDVQMSRKMSPSVPYVDQGDINTQGALHGASDDDGDGK